MPRIYSIALAAAVMLAASPLASADNGENSAAIAAAVQQGIAAAAANSGGGWVSMAFAFGSALGVGLLAVLKHQADTKWHLFHAQNAIDNARAQNPPGLAPTDGGKS